MKTRGKRQSFWILVRTRIQAFIHNQRRTDLQPGTRLDALRTEYRRLDCEERSRIRFRNSAAFAGFDVRAHAEEQGLLAEFERSQEDFDRLVQRKAEVVGEMVALVTTSEERDWQPARVELPPSEVQPGVLALADVVAAARAVTAGSSHSLPPVTRGWASPEFPIAEVRLAPGKRVQLDWGSRIETCSLGSFVEVLEEACAMFPGGQYLYDAESESEPRQLASNLSALMAPLWQSQQARSLLRSGEPGSLLLLRAMRLYGALTQLELFDKWGFYWDELDAAFDCVGESLVPTLSVFGETPPDVETTMPFVDLLDCREFAALGLERLGQQPAPLKGDVAEIQDSVRRELSPRSKTLARSGALKPLLVEDAEKFLIEGGGLASFDVIQEAASRVLCLSEETLDLSGLTNLSGPVAQILSCYDGDLRINLEALGERATSILRAHPSLKDQIVRTAHTKPEKDPT